MGLHSVNSFYEIGPLLSELKLFESKAAKLSSRNQKNGYIANRFKGKSANFKSRKEKSGYSTNLFKR